MPRRSKKSRTQGPYSRPLQLAKLDHRTSEGILVRRLRADLTELVGGNPTIAQATLIEQACILSLKLAMMNRKLIRGGEFNECDTNHYISWSNALNRILSNLTGRAGVESSRDDADPMSALQQHLTQHRGQDIAA